MNMTDRDLLRFRLLEALHALRWAQKYIIEHPNCIEKAYDREYFLHRIGRILGRGKELDDQPGINSVGGNEAS